MATYLLTWNPKRWEWPDLDRVSDAVRHGKQMTRRWSCSNTRSIEPGDRVFLIRLGKEPRGIFGSGNVISGPYKDTHWDKERAKVGEVTLFIDLRFDALHKPETDPILSREQLLSDPNFSEMHWDTQRSGVEIPQEVAEHLEIAWARIVAGHRLLSAAQVLGGVADQSAYASARWGNGGKLYQERARRILPVLVRQAKAQQTIVYSELAQEVDIPNPRNLDWPLGAIGNALFMLSEVWGEKVPPIQTLVVNKQTRLPGLGFYGFFAHPEQIRQSSSAQKRAIVHLLLRDVFHFDRWDQVLDALGLEPLHSEDVRVQDRTSLVRLEARPESKRHRDLKEFVAGNPGTVGLPKSAGPGELEHLFPSADALDVLFMWHGEWIGAEVKSRSSGTLDITRGLFQCVKYLALMEAEQKAGNMTPNARINLVLEDTLPVELIGLRNALGINVVENVNPHP